MKVIYKNIVICLIIVKTLLEKYIHWKRCKNTFYILYYINTFSRPRVRDHFLKLSTVSYLYETNVYYIYESTMIKC